MAPAANTLGNEEAHGLSREEERSFASVLRLSYGGRDRTGDRRFTRIRQSTEEEDMRQHWDVSAFDNGTGRFVFWDLKMALPSNRASGNYSVKASEIDWLANECERELARDYMFAFQLYDFEGRPTGEYASFPALAVCENIYACSDRSRNGALPDDVWLVNYENAEAAVGHAEVFRPDV